MKENLLTTDVQTEIATQLQMLLLYTSRIEKSITIEYPSTRDSKIIYFRNQIMRFNLISHDICALFLRKNLNNHYGLIVLYRALILDIIAIKNFECTFYLKETDKHEEVKIFSEAMLLDYAKIWHDECQIKEDKMKIINFFSYCQLESKFEDKISNKYIKNKNKFPKLNEQYQYLSKFDHFSFYTIMELDENYRIGEPIRDRILSLHNTIFEGLSSLLSIFCNFIFNENSNIYEHYSDFMNCYSNFGMLKNKNYILDKLICQLNSLKKSNPEADTSDLEAEIDMLVYEFMTE